MIRVFSIAVFASLLASQTLAAAPPADQLLPTTTKGFLSVPDVEDLETRWEQTQLGKLAADPVMKPFSEDLERQIHAPTLQIADGEKRVVQTAETQADHQQHR